MNDLQKNLIPHAEDETHALLANFQTAAQAHFDRCREQWRQIHLEKLSIFRTGLVKLLSGMEANKPGTDKLIHIWMNWEEYFRQQQNIVSDFGYVKQDGDLSNYISNWNAAFQQFIETVPEKAVFLEKPGDWSPQKADSIRITLWKKWRRTRHASATVVRNITNRFRKLSGKQQLSDVIYKRTVLQQNFCRFYLEQPGETHLFEAWNRYLQQVGRQLLTVHKLTQEISQIYLFLDNAKAIWLENQTNIIDEAQSSVRESIEKIDALIQEFDAFVEEESAGFTPWLTNTAALFINQLHYAGTYILPNETFDKTALQQQQKSLSTQFETHRTAWRDCFTAIRDDWLSDIALKIIQLEAGQCYERSESAINQRVRSQIIPAFSQAVTAFSTVSEKFTNLDIIPEKKELRKLILTESYALLKLLRNKLLPEIASAFVKTQFNQVISRYLHEIQIPVDALPEKQAILISSELDQLPPRTQVDEIPLKELFYRELLQHLTGEATDFDRKMQQQFTQIMIGVSELDQVVEFNMKAALDVLKETDSPEESLRQVTEGLQRAEERLSDYITQSLKLEENSCENLFNVTFKFVGDVQELLDNEFLMELKLKLVRVKAREKFLNTRRRIWRFIKRAVPAAATSVVSVVRMVYEQYLKLGKLTGLVTASQASQEQLFQYLAETQQKISALPYIYKRLFAIEPLDDERLFASRERELSLLKEDLQTWQQGRFMSTAIVGERGSGRTTLLNFAKKHVYKGLPIKEMDIDETLYLTEGNFLPLIQTVFGFEDCKTFEAFEQAVLALENPVICIVENIQNLFIRTIKGFDLLKRFLQMIYHTQEKVFWVATCTQYSWAYLDKVTGISQHFQRVLSLQGLSREDMENIIMKRHRITGYQLGFETPKEIEKSRAFRKLRTDDDRNEFMKNRFFTELHDLAQGNITITLLYWLRSIKTVEKNRLVLSSSVSVDYSFIYQLSTTELFTLGALLQHEMLTVNEHARIFHQSVDESDLLFHALSRKGIIMPSPHGYRIHPFLYRPVVRALKNNHILH